MHGCSFERGLDMGHQHIQHQNIKTGHIFPHKGPLAVKSNKSITNWRPSASLNISSTTNGSWPPSNYTTVGLKVNAVANSVVILKWFLGGFLGSIWANVWCSRPGNACLPWTSLIWIPIKTVAGLWSDSKSRLCIDLWHWDSRTSSNLVLPAAEKKGPMGLSWGAKCQNSSTSLPPMWKPSPRFGSVYVEVMEGNEESQYC